MRLALGLSLWFACACGALAAEETEAAWRERLTELLGAGSLGSATQAGSKIFYLRRSGTEEQASLLVRDSARHPARMLIDPGRLGPDKQVVQEDFFPSQNGALVAYALKERAAARCRIRIREVDSGLDWPDFVPADCRASVAWLEDRSGFYYTAQAESASLPADPGRMRQSVFLHRPGTDPLRDDKILTQVLGPRQRLKIQTSSDGRYLLVFNSDGRVGTQLLLHDTRSPQTPFSLLSKSGQAFSRVAMKGEDIYLLTLELNARSKLLRLDLRKPYRIYGLDMDEDIANPSSWKVLLKEKEGGWRLKDFRLAGPHLAVQVAERGGSRLQLYTDMGEPINEVHLPLGGAINSFDSNPFSSSISLIHESILEPPRLISYDISRSSAIAVESLHVLENPNLFKVIQENYYYHEKKHGAIYLVGQNRVRRNKRNLILLEAGDAPRFSPGLIAWLEKGGIYALAVPEADEISTDNFIAASNWLIKREYTAAHLLAELKLESSDRYSPKNELERLTKIYLFLSLRLKRED